MARSGEVILDSLYNNAILQELIPSRMPRTRIGLLFSVIASEFEGWEMVLDNFKNETFLSTATLISSLELLCEPFYLKSPERPSDVIVQFYWKQGTPEDSKEDTVIPFVKIIMTDDNDPIEYMTIERKVLYKTATLVHARARSIEKGTHTMVGPLYLSKINSPPSSYIEVYNEKSSWGGKDSEAMDSVKSNALAARYTMTRGTLDDIVLTLSNAGLPRSYYNIVDQAYGYGSFAIHVRTDVDEEINEIKELVDDARAEGIYSECLEAIPKDSTLAITTKFSRHTNFTPEEYNLILGNIQEAVLEYAIDNGVGQKLFVGKLKHFLLEVFDEDNIYDVEVEFTSGVGIDYYGNAILSQSEYLNITGLDIDIQVG
jgi:hypothetical protein